VRAPRSHRLYVQIVVPPATCCHGHGASARAPAGAAAPPGRIPRSGRVWDAAGDAGDVGAAGCALNYGEASCRRLTRRCTGLGERPTPGGGKGTLTVRDSRTGTTYEIQASAAALSQPGRAARSAQCWGHRLCVRAVALRSPGDGALTQRHPRALSTPQVADLGYIHATDIAKIHAGGDGFGLKLYDPVCV